MSFRSEPATFNRYVSAQQIDEVIARVTHATLVRLNRSTGAIEPRLATGWSTSPDGLTWTFTLRDGVTFSDGEPFTSADVVFSFLALYDERVKSPIATSLKINDEPLRVRALDASTVVVVFPAPYGPGLELLDAVPILPRHRLHAALEDGTFATAWSVTTDPSQIAGLGPFSLREYRPGERLVFARNPRFWRQDEQGNPLPYLDAIELHFVPDQNAEIVRLQSGAIDMMQGQVRFEDLGSLRTLEGDGKLTLHDAGVSIAPDMMWFNLDPSAPGVGARPWLQREELRHAISLAVDRQAIVNTVFLGQGVEIAGPITPGHGRWFVSDVTPPARDPAAASRLLSSIGLSDRTGDGLLDDERGRTATFSMLTQKGHSVRERTAAMIQEQLRGIGLAIDVVPLEVRSMVEQWSQSQYDAMLFAIEFDSIDPGRHPDFWLSSGSFHFWRPRQPTPASDWEARIDALMKQNATTLDIDQRRDLSAEAQRELARHLPVLYFAAPRVLLAASSRVRGLQPSVLAPNLLWNAESISVASDSANAVR